VAKEGLQISVKIDTGDLEKVARKLNVLPAFKDGIKAGAIYVKGVIAEYPPMSSGNMPGAYPKKWYVRGKGPHWALKGGGIHFRRTSEVLGKRWTHKIFNDGLSAVVGNNASYAPYVQSREHQPPWHKAHGWNTAENVVETENDEVIKRIQMFIDAALTRGRP
jgi:hypothetical protein